MAKLGTRGNYWILSWTDEAGKRHRDSLGRIDALPKRDAEACLRIKRYELSTGARLLNAHRRPAPRFDTWLTDYLLWHRMEYPSSHYRIQQIALDHLKPEFGLLPLNLITPAQVEQYKSKRRFLVKGSTVTKELRVLQAIINRAVDTKVISENPVSIVKAPPSLDSKPHRYYETAELERLYVVSGKRAAWWRLMANTGVRRSEALMLRWLWVTDSTIRILSAEDERTKSGKWRPIPRSDGATIALAALAGEGTHVLPRIQPESLSRAFSKDAAKAGLDGSLHTLRHTYICHLLLANVPIRTVQLYAGHANIATTEKYAYQVLRQDPAGAVRMSL